MMDNPPWGPAPTAAADPLRAGAANLLRRASELLDRLARDLAHVEPRAETELVRQPVLEFHADAGAPEGALYVDGRLVGHLLGVNRL
jgi:hypothetical protein